LARFAPESDGTYRPVTNDLPPATQAKMPADWSKAFGPEFLGRVCYRRTFQKPTGLEEDQRVWLVVEPARSRGTVSLAGELLGSVRFGESPGRYDVTDRLREHNNLEILVEHPWLDAVTFSDDDDTTRPAGGLVGEVRLEIEE
jgi:hypothetical protein